MTTKRYRHDPSISAVDARKRGSSWFRFRIGMSVNGGHRRRQPLAFDPLTTAGPALRYVCGVTR